MEYMRQVYILTFPDGKVYVGCANDARLRWDNGKGYIGQAVGKAIEKFGWKNVKKEIVVNFKEGSVESHLLCNKAEKFLIELYQNKSYNEVYTEAYRKKVSKKLKEVKRNERILIPVNGEKKTLSEIDEEYGSGKVCYVRQLLKDYYITIDTAFELPKLPPNRLGIHRLEYWKECGYDVRKTSREEQKYLCGLGQTPGAFWNYIYETRGTGINRMKQEA